MNHRGGGAFLCSGARPPATTSIPLDRPGNGASKQNGLDFLVENKYKGVLVGGIVGSVNDIIFLSG